MEKIHSQHVCLYMEYLNTISPKQLSLDKLYAQVNVSVFLLSSSVINKANFLEIEK